MKYIGIKKRKQVTKNLFCIIFIGIAFSFSALAQDKTYTYHSLYSLMDNHNRELQKAREEYAQSMLDVKDAKAGFYPEATFTATGTYMSNPMIDTITI
ncbi:MAG TPA: hypothetical protein VFC68_00315, partial [Treponemataceae bacterium]|nr:hypothetical protein [Treponemataceae bacterium]